MGIRSTIERETEQRLDMLNEQLEWAKAALVTAEKFETENPNCDWECVCGAIDGAIRFTQHYIDSIDDWVRERYDDYAAGKADYERDLRMENE